MIQETAKHVTTDIGGGIPKNVINHALLVVLIKIKMTLNVIIILEVVQTVLMRILVTFVGVHVT